MKVSFAHEGDATLCPALYAASVVSSTTLLGDRRDGFGGIVPGVIQGVIAVAMHPALYIACEPHVVKVLN